MKRPNWYRVTVLVVLAAMLAGIGWWVWGCAEKAVIREQQRVEATIEELQAALAAKGAEWNTLELRRVKAQAQDEAVWSIGENILTIGLSAAGLGGLGTVAGGLIGLVRGKKKGAQAVFDVVEAGKNASPDFREWFEANTAAAQAMRSTLNALPAIAEAFKAWNATPDLVKSDTAGQPIVAGPKAS